MCDVADRTDGPRRKRGSRPTVTAAVEGRVAEVGRTSTARGFRRGPATLQMVPGCGSERRTPAQARQSPDRAGHARRENGRGKPGCGSPRFPTRARDTGNAGARRIGRAANSGRPAGPGTQKRRAGAPDTLLRSCRQGCTKMRECARDPHNKRPRARPAVNGRRPPPQGPGASTAPQGRTEPRPTRGPRANHANHCF
jgi:hypothetical protein